MRAVHFARFGFLFLRFFGFVSGVILPYSALGLHGMLQKIVDADPVKVGKPDHKIHGNGALSFLIATIYLPLAAQEVGDVLLRQIVIDPKVVYSFEIHFLFHP